MALRRTTGNPPRTWEENLMASILIVDDDPDIALLLEHKLRAGGHQVTVAVDGVAGLEAIQASRPDLVVLDWMMPRMNGLDVCAQVRADPRIATTRILMLTAKAQAQDLERVYTSGADDYMQKPFSPRDLAARVDQLLAH
ncbi:response regulator [Demequina capsici]|uniref:Response regulator n=1 Tax=Demequina capsici TaxID=3075620 RepID=A0AA96F8D3_9MICO|nr:MULTISPECIES: response regulator [unclassified Demequina]WNM23876.1 response regulator [Demequina sp. OYTSA14]WNM26715.1 response regulator [Demequina sp. PMTSA13]